MPPYISFLKIFPIGTIIIPILQIRNLGFKEGKYLALLCGGWWGQDLDSWVQSTDA